MYHTNKKSTDIMQYFKYLVVILVLSLMGSFLNENGMIALNELEAKKTSLSKENLELSVEIESLERMVGKLRTDPKTVELAANRKLGMIRHDETIYVFKSADRKPLKAGEQDHAPANN